MARKHQADFMDVCQTASTLLCFSLLTTAAAPPPLPAGEDPQEHFHVSVDMVMLTFTATDSDGHYLRGLQPSDLCVREDGVTQRVVTLIEGGGPATGAPAGFQGVNVFVLLDTSNWMYSTLPYASDAVADFIRGVDPTSSIALYKFSKNLFRSVPLTTERWRVLSGARATVAGSDTALYNALILTLRDALKVSGRKAVVVFSNGRDNASIVAPDDVGLVAEDAGIPLYLVATENPEHDPVSANVFRRLTAMTGGRLFWAESWRKQSEAFSRIRNDLANSYTLAYYPAASSNQGFRRISVEIISKSGKKYNIRARAGYYAPAR